MTSVARRMFDDYGCDAVTIDGDFYTDDLGGPYDVVFSSFNHSVSDSRMCDVVFSAVRPGGILILRRHVRRGDTDPRRRRGRSGSEAPGFPRPRSTWM